MLFDKYDIYGPIDNSDLDKKKTAKAELKAEQ